MRLKLILERGRPWHFALLAALLGLCLLLWWAIYPYILYPVAEVFNAPAFAAIDSGMISVRTDNGALLLRLVSHEQLLREEGSPAATQPVSGERDEAVYRYDPQKHTLSEVTSDAWRSAPGEIALDQYGGGSGFTIERGKGVAVAYKAGVPIKAKGRTALAMARLLPHGKVVAIISATGWRHSGFFPGFGGSSGVSGKHFCEFFAVADLKRVYKPVYLPIGSPDELLIGCWTADEQYFVVTSLNLYSRITRIAIIRMSEVGGNERIAD